MKALFFCTLVSFGALTAMRPELAQLVSEFQDFDCESFLLAATTMHHKTKPNLIDIYKPVKSAKKLWAAVILTSQIQGEINHKFPEYAYNPQEENRGFAHKFWSNSPKEITYKNNQWITRWPLVSMICDLDEAIKSESCTEKERGQILRVRNFFQSVLDDYTNTHNPSSCHLEEPIVGGK